MTVFTTRRTPRVVATLLLATGLLAGALALAMRSTRATAEPVSLTLTYMCSFPLIGSQPMSVEINADIPTQIAPGVPTGSFQIDAVAGVSETARLGLRTVGAATLEGTVRSSANLSVPGLDLPLSVDMSVPSVPVPTASGGFTVNATGSTPSLTFTAQNAGPGTITVGDLVMTLSPKTAAGGPTGLGTFESTCTQDPGQDNVLQRITIGGGTTPTTQPVTTTRPTTATSATTATTATTRSTTTTRPTATTATTRPTTPTTGPSTIIKLDYGMSGSTFVAAANGTAPIVGSISTNFDLVAGTHRGPLTLQPAQGKFMIAGLLQTNVNIEFTPIGEVTGTLIDGKLVAHTQMNIKLENIAILGVLPIVGAGANCQSSTPVTIDLTSPDGEVFDPLQGGKLSGTYTLPKFNNCGWLGALVNIFVQGPSNTIDVTLTSSGQG